MAQEKKGMGLTSQIFIGLILGVIFGHIFPHWGIALKSIGDIFIRMIKMIVVPLIFSSLVMGLMGNCIATIVVARWEDELPDEVLQKAYARSYND